MFFFQLRSTRKTRTLYILAEKSFLILLQIILYSHKSVYSLMVISMQNIYQMLYLHSFFLWRLPLFCMAIWQFSMGARCKWQRVFAAGTTRPKQMCVSTYYFHTEFKYVISRHMDPYISIKFDLSIHMFLFALSPQVKLSYCDISIRLCNMYAGVEFDSAVNECIFQHGQHWGIVSLMGCFVGK